MNLFELSAKISVDDSNFKKSMENAQKVSQNVATAMKNLQSPLDKAKSGFNAIAHPVEAAKANIEKLKNATEAIRHPIEAFKNKVADASTALETKRNKLSVLASSYDSAKKNVESLTKEFNKSAKESGTSSQKTQELAKKLNEAEKEAEEAKKELDDYSKSVSNAGKNSDAASNGVGNFASKLGKGFATVGKIGVAAVGAASTAIVALGKIGLDYNSQMEQYTTNFTTMLGSQEAAVQKVQELKEFAASTPLSMDDLAKATQTLLAFGVDSENSTGILRQLGDIALGDADKMQRLSTAFGKATAAGKVTGDTVQQMIDAGWNPLIQISKAAGETMEETQKRMSAGKISVEELKAAMEAVTSGTGQFAGGMEAASHTTQGLISTLQDNAKALVGEVYMPISEGLKNTVLPSAINAISTLSEAFKENGINGMIAAAGEMLGSLVNSIVEYAPKVVDAAVTLVSSLIQGLSENQESIATGAIQIITSLATGILNMLPQIIALGLDLIVSLANGIAESLPELIPTIIDVVLQIVDTLTDPETLSSLIDASIAIIIALADGLINSLPKLIEKAPTIISNLVTAIVNNVPKLLVAAVEVIKKLATGIIDNLPQIGQAAGEIIGTLFNGIMDLGSELWNIGSNIVSGIWNGIVDNFDVLYENVKGFFSGIIDGVKNILGIHSPSRVFAGIGENMALGLGEGWDDEFGNIKKDIKNGMDFGVATVGVDSSAISRNYSGAVSSGIDKPITIIVQSVLDGKVIGETAYNYNRRKARAGGT